MDPSEDELSKVHPEIEEIFKKHGIPKLPLPNRQNLSVFRKNYSKVIARFNKGPLAKKFIPTEPNWTEQDTSITVRDGSLIKLRVYVPKSTPSGGAPVTLIAHGGGWYMGDLDTEALLCQILCHNLSIVVVNVDYRLYPEVEFPKPILDVYDAVKWIASNISTFTSGSANLSKGFIVGGNSGGATFASIAVHLARDEHLTPPVTGCFLSCPILTDEWYDEDGNTLHTFAGRNLSHESCRNAPLMDRAMQNSIQEFASFDYHSPLLTPFNFPSHRDVPATYIVVCGLDPWRDTGRIYGEELEKCGGVVKVDVYTGLPHCWWTTYPMLDVSEKWVGDVLGGFSWLLEGGRDIDKGSKL